MIATKTERTSEVFMLLLDAELSAAALFISPKHALAKIMQQMHKKLAYNFANGSAR
jgi:hypothetical protein